MNFIKEPQYYESKGIPTFAGVPLIESMDEMSLSSKCGWLNLSLRNSLVNKKHSERRC